MANRSRVRTEPRPPLLPTDDRLSPGPHEWEPEATLTRLAFLDVDLAGQRAESVEVDRCAFRKGTLAGSRLLRLSVTHCVAETVDWSNVDGAGGTLDRSVARGSRMTGLSWAAGSVRDVVFDECRLDLSNWRFTAFDAVRFTGCQLSGADFTSADLRGASFVDCDLTGAQFSAATMEGARFRGCDLAGVGGVESFRGASVHRDDLLGLARVLATALGIGIREND
jgi:uncharacterized protein YjbI with pentapeptide repeats